MVVPLAMLLAAGGTGLQMYGQSKRSGAQKAALARLQAHQDASNRGSAAEYAVTNAALGSLGQQADASNAQAVDDLSAANLRQAFAGQSGELGQRISAITDATPQAGQDAMQAAGQNTAFLNARARSKMRNDINTDALAQVLQNNAGLAGANETFRMGMADKTDRDFLIRKRIDDILRMQNYANGVREAALQRAGAEHSLDQARAASVGSGAMYLGALMQAGSPLANRGQPGTLSAGHWQQALTGQFGNPANGVDYNYVPNADQTMTTGVA